MRYRLPEKCGLSPAGKAAMKRAIESYAEDPNSSFDPLAVSHLSCMASANLTDLMAALEMCTISIKDRLVGTKKRTGK